MADKVYSLKHPFAMLISKVLRKSKYSFAEIKYLYIFSVKEKETTDNASFQLSYLYIYIFNNVLKLERFGYPGH